MLKKKLEENDNELNMIKKKLMENIQSFNNINNDINYQKHFNDQEYEINDYDADDVDENINNSYYYNSGQLSNKYGKIKRNNYYFAQLNKKNLDDLDAIYFFDKINSNINGKIVKNNKDNIENNYNYVSNNGELVPELNLDPDYIEDCKNKELLKIEEANLTPFQRIALHFEMS